MFYLQFFVCFPYAGIYTCIIPEKCVKESFKCHLSFQCFIFFVTLICFYLHKMTLHMICALWKYILIHTFQRMLCGSGHKCFYKNKKVHYHTLKNNTYGNSH